MRHSIVMVGNYPVNRDLFESRISKSNECWLWTGYVNADGYGVYDSVMAHRVAYTLYVNSIPEGFEVDHTCHTIECSLGSQCPHRRCVNPAHLAVVPKAVNTERKSGGPHQPPRDKCRRGHPLTDDNRRVNGQCRYCSYVSSTKPYGTPLPFDQWIKNRRAQGRG